MLAFLLFVFWWMLAVAFVSPAVAASTTTETPKLDLEFHGDTGEFVITVGDDDITLESVAPTVDDKPLTFGSYRRFKGQDKLGNFTSYSVRWKDEKEEEILETSLQQYHDPKDVLVFVQTILINLEKAAAPSSSLLARTIWPVFSKSSISELPCASYHGIFPRLQTTPCDQYQPSHQGGAPLILWNASQHDLPMVVFSPLDKPKAQHFSLDGAGNIGAGIKATAEFIPAGYQQRFMMSASAGLNHGMMKWGSRLLTWLGSCNKRNADNRYRDNIHSTIGFWTDNGGYYHYSIGKNASLGHNYQEVLLNVHNLHLQKGIPFGHWQFDSWFYPKDHGGAVTNWTAASHVFPNGMKYMQSKLQLPMVLHNRYWSPHSDYIKANLPQLEWYTSEKSAIPKDSLAFFTWFFQQQTGWGMSMYEQDWMCTQYNFVDALQTNLTLADQWLHGMNQAAMTANLTIQYCMPYVYDVLASASFEAVTNARATDDYIGRDTNWALGATSLLYHAINLLPFKDGFYSSTYRQVGGETEGPELYPNRHAIMATLSTAMVGPMDGYGYANKTRIMSTCRSDGLVLKPDKPITTIDACFRDWDSTASPENCHRYSTWSTMKGTHKKKTLYYFDNNATASLNLADLGIANGSKWIMLDWYSQQLTRLSGSSSSPVKLSGGYEGHIYATLNPILEDQFVFVGEMDKICTVSQARFENFVASKEDGLFVDVIGAKGETVHVCAARVSDLVLVCQDVYFSIAATQQVAFFSKDDKDDPTTTSMY